jgi:hypothetical protein
VISPLNTRGLVSGECISVERTRIEVFEGETTMVYLITLCNPSADHEVSEEICDGLDNDGDGETDEGLMTDNDGDGYYSSSGACFLVSSPSDCDDSDPAVHPGAQEICDSKDNDCDPATPETQGCCISAPVDILLLEDLSGSFSEDLPIVAELAPYIWSALTRVSESVRVGIASFVDKPFYPYGDTDDYVFNVDQALTADKAAFINAINTLEVRSGNDYSEAQLEALLHVAMQTENVGWRDDDDVVRYVVMSTDATYHEGQECLEEGLCDTPNNGDGIIHPKEDFPTAKMVAGALATRRITPVFLVTKDVIAEYTHLLSVMGIDDVPVPLRHDSINIIDALQKGLGCSEP